jgi:hypothetical protein
MKTYYLHNGNENEGPFELEELKSRKITRTTPIWTAGMEDWKPAGEMEELKSILATVPPTIKSFSTAPKELEEENKASYQKIWGLTKKNFFLVTAALVLFIGILITNYLQESRKTNLERKNNLTEKNNQQYLLQQKEIQEQRKRIAEQDSLELERVAKEEQQAITNRILEIKNSLSVSYSNLKLAKAELNNAAEFQFLRTNSQKVEDVDLAQNNIEYLKNEIAALEKEIDLLYLRLEKIHL